MKVRITARGTAPLLMHNIQLANSRNPYAKALKSLNSKRIKTDEDSEEIAKLEYLGGLYFDPELGPYIPGANLEKSLVEGARISRNGKKIERGLFVTEMMLPLAYNGPRDGESLWEDVNYQDSSAVRIGGARIIRYRPKFPKWALEADAEIDTRVLNFDELVDIAETAGAMIGIGDYRPRFGRFETSVERL